MTASDEPIDDERVLALIEIHRHPSGKPNETAIAKALGRSPNGIKRAIQRLAREGRLGTSPVIPGFEITRITSKDEDGNFVTQRPTADAEEFALPDGHILERTSQKIGDAWFKTKLSNLPDPLAYVAELEAAFAGFTPAAPSLPIPDLDYSDHLTLYPWADPHIGLLTWKSETRDNWDLRIAVKTFKEVFAKVVARTPPTKKAILCVGGDTLHADDNRNITPASGNPLQVDGRHPKVFITACETIAEIATSMLAKHADLEIMVLPGNHDPTSAAPIAYFLKAWFRNEPRITVDVSPSLFRFRQFGKVMLGFTHGHTIKKQKAHEVMAQYAPEIWGQTKFRFCHTFHVHHDSMVEHGGCVTETHQILPPADAWHYGAGYGAGRSQKSISYDPVKGQSGRSFETI